MRKVEHRVAAALHRVSLGKVDRIADGAGRVGSAVAIGGILAAGTEVSVGHVHARQFARDASHLLHLVGHPRCLGGFDTGLLSEGPGREHRSKEQEQRAGAGDGHEGSS